MPFPPREQRRDVRLAAQVFLTSRGYYAVIVTTLCTLLDGRYLASRRRGMNFQISGRVPSA